MAGTCGTCKENEVAVEVDEDGGYTPACEFCSAPCSCCGAAGDAKVAALCDRCRCVGCNAAPAECDETKCAACLTAAGYEQCRCGSEVWLELGGGFCGVCCPASRAA